MTPKSQRAKSKNPRSLEFNTTVEPTTADSTRVFGDSSYLVSESETSSGTKPKRKRDDIKKHKKMEKDSSSDSSQKSNCSRFKTPMLPRERKSDSYDRDYNRNYSKYDNDSRKRDRENKKAPVTKKIDNELQEKTN